MSKKKKGSRVTLKGYIDQYFETGCEGIMWYFFQDGKTGYEAIVSIDDGDHLTVFGENGETLFHGAIDQDWKVGYQPYPLNPKYGQPCALGYWVHWTQKDWRPDDWAKLFFHQYLKGNEDKPPLRAELIKNELCVECKKNKKLRPFQVCKTCRNKIAKEIKSKNKTA